MNSWPSIWNLVSEIVGRKNAAEFFLYLPIFKVTISNLQVYHFHLILGPATNQKWFKYTFQQCIVCSVFEIACSFDFRKTWRNLLQDRELLKKVMNSYKNLAFSKVIVRKQYWISFQMLFIYKQYVFSSCDIDLFLAIQLWIISASSKWSNSKFAVTKQPFKLSRYL